MPTRYRPTCMHITLYYPPTRITYRPPIILRGCTCTVLSPYAYRIPIPYPRARMHIALSYPATRILCAV
eukprot:828710-Rhodomonas_salina.1